MDEFKARVGRRMPPSPLLVDRLTDRNNAPPPYIFFQGDSAKEVFERLMKQPAADFTSPIWKTKPAGAIDLLKRLLNKDPAARMTAADALKCGLSTPLIIARDGAWNDLLTLLLCIRAVVGRLLKNITNWTVVHPEWSACWTDSEVGRSRRIPSPPHSRSPLPRSPPPPPRCACRHPWMLAHSAKAAVPVSVIKSRGMSDSASGLTCDRLSADPTISEGGEDDNDDAPATPSGGSAGPSITSRQASGGGTVSARIFCPPENLKTRVLMHGFIDLYKKRVEAPYTLLLKVPS